ncbi:energy-coupling factor transporter transmembrane component T family protein [Vagococcus humatus]|nr:energy-coupling factor transporter transmembrane component T [Vagococcus humatus]
MINIQIKCLLLFITHIFLFIPFHPVQQTVLVGLLLSILFLEKERKRSLLYGSIYLVLLGILIALPYFKSFLGHSFGQLAMVFLLLYPCFLAGSLLIRTSLLSDWILLLKKCRLPMYLILPITVMFRFIPHFKEDFKHTFRLQKMRVPHSSLFKRLERTLIVLLHAAIQSSQELTMAALAKGINQLETRPVSKLTSLTFLDYLVATSSLGLIVWRSFL